MPFTTQLMKVRGCVQGLATDLRTLSRTDVQVDLRPTLDAAVETLHEILRWMEVTERKLVEVEVQANRRRFF